MSKKNDHFFDNKYAWSKVKDELLGCYLKPYIHKILHTNRPLIYVDCFAGKGKFGDGNPGSPLIAMDIIDKCLQTNVRRTKIETVFIEREYANDLKNNLQGYSVSKIISGRFEKEISNVLQNKLKYNVFLYVDPYGIKSLSASMFDKFARAEFNSLELLINLNSFGFIREACRVTGINFDIGVNDFFDDLTEYDNSRMDKSEESVAQLNEIAGGEYWQDIVNRYNIREHSVYRAEELFARQYCIRLARSFKYVLNMPLRIKEGRTPKYRMVYATNHPDGCILMVDNIWRRMKSLLVVRGSKQDSLFPLNVEDNIIDRDAIEKEFSKFLEKEERLNEFLARFYTAHGMVCDIKTANDILLKLERNNEIIVSRTPQTTKKGKPSKFMFEGKGKKVVLRKQGSVLPLC